MERDEQGSLEPDAVRETPEPTWQCVAKNEDVQKRIMQQTHARTRLSTNRRPPKKRRTTTCSVARTFEGWQEIGEQRLLVSCLVCF